jgi:transglutaminase-like putative cysteine protease
MRIRAGYKITYDCPVETPMLMMVNLRPERGPDLESPDTVLTDPFVPVRQYIDTFGNVCSRVVAPPGLFTIHSEFIVKDSGIPDPVLLDAVQHPIEDLPDAVIEYLLPSRYCDTELLRDLAWRLFADTPPGWARVQAIVDYAHNRVTFGYEHAHLAITLCRCMNIPARYVTGYMGDIGIPVHGVMDFSAWFQVWLGGAWHTFDARHNMPRIGRLLMAIGRDATDVAIVTTFGSARLVEFTVITEELK